MNRKHTQGLSLVEVLVAISVLAIVVVGVSVIPALTLGRNTDARTYAVNIAREVLDTYRAAWLKQADFQSGTAPTILSGVTLRFGCTVAAPAVVNYNVQASDASLVAAVGAPKIRKVTVTVTCPNSGGVSLSTYIGDPMFSGA